MPNTSMVDDELLKLWQKVARAEMFAHHVPALLGSENVGGGFTIPVSAWPGFVYVRRFQAGALTVDKAINRAGVVEAGDLPIWLDRDADGRWIIIGERYTGGEVGVPVIARCSTNAGQSFTTAVTTIVNFEDVTFDPWSAVTVGASWAFTAPADGFYQVSALVEFATTVNWVVGERAQLQVYKNGALYALLDAQENNGATTHNVILQGDDVIQLTAGDTLDVRVTQASGAALALVATTENNHVSIVRIS